MRIAAAQTAPVWGDKEATTARVVEWIEKAADDGVDLVAFGETFLSGYPFWVARTDGARWEAEDQKAAEFQISGLLHLEARKCKAAVPKIRRTRDGASSTTILLGETRHVVRLVSYLPGRLLADVPPTPLLMRAIGRSLERLDIALSDFECDGDQQPLLWDMQRAAALIPFRSLSPTTSMAIFRP